MIRAATLLGLVGLAFATGLFIWEGVGSVLSTFAAAGMGILWASLFHFVSMVFTSRGWQILLPLWKRAPLPVFFWAVWLREAVNGLLPVARIGGEFVSAQFLVRRRLRPDRAVASLVVDMTLSLVSQFVFTLIGVALLLIRGDGDGAMMHDLSLGLLATIPLVVAFIIIQRVGFFSLLARLFRVIFGDRLDALVGGAEPLDLAVRRFYRRRRALFACTLWQLAGWMAGAGEIWLALLFLGYPASLSEALIVESVIQAVSSGAFVVPGAFGIQEGGFLIIGSVIGLPPDLALALALARRARDIIIYVPVLVAWQIGAGRRALATV